MSTPESPIEGRTLVERIASSRLGRGVVIGASVVALAAGANTAKDLISPDGALAADPGAVCTTQVQGNTKIEDCVYPDGSTSHEETTVINSDQEDPESQPEEGSQGQSPKPKPDKPKKPKKDRGEERDPEDSEYNLLELPKNRNTAKYWATRILNEHRKGDDGRISLNREVIVDLKRTRQGRCARVEQTGGCVTVDKTLLNVLFKAAQVKKFYIWHITDGPHVSTSFHFSDGKARAADLRRYNKKAPTNKSMEPIIRRVTPRGKSLEMIGPGDDANHTGPKNGHWHIAVY